MSPSLYFTNDTRNIRISRQIAKSLGVVSFSPSKLFQCFPRQRSKIAPSYLRLHRCKIFCKTACRTKRTSLPHEQPRKQLNLTTIYVCDRERGDRMMSEKREKLLILQIFTILCLILSNFLSITKIFNFGNFNFS